MENIAREPKASDYILMTLKNLERAIKRCKKCRLYKSRLRAVPGEGNPKAKVVFIGEAPGREENKQGKPFVGGAGKFLEKLLKSINLEREKVFITNIVKCRPPENRDPLKDEIKACELYLKKQLEIIKPKIIVTLGRHSLNWFLAGAKLSRIHGHIKRTVEFYILPLYHPAAVMYNPSLRKTMIKDFKNIRRFLK